MSRDPFAYSKLQRKQRPPIITTRPMSLASLSPYERKRFVKRTGIAQHTRRRRRWIRGRTSSSMLPELYFLIKIANSACASSWFPPIWRNAAPTILGRITAAWAKPTTASHSALLAIKSGFSKLQGYPRYTYPTWPKSPCRFQSWGSKYKFAPSNPCH